MKAGTIQEDILRLRLNFLQNVEHLGRIETLEGKYYQDVDYKHEVMANRNAIKCIYNHLKLMDDILKDLLSFEAEF
jgi:hypothetical protein